MVSDFGEWTILDEECAGKANIAGRTVKRPSENKFQTALVFVTHQIRIGITMYLKFGLLGMVNKVERLASPKASCMSSACTLRSTSIR